MKLRLADRAHLYRNLAQLVQAGVAPTSQVDALQRGARNPALRIFLSRLRSVYDAGNPLSEAMLHSADLGVPTHHKAVVAAAERSGHVTEALIRLATLDETRNAARRELLSRSAYPILLFHFAILGPSVAFLLSNPLRAIGYALAILIPADLVLIAIYRALTATQGKRPGLQWLRRLPVVEAAVSDRQAAEYLGTLSQLYEAGVPILDASKIALDAIEDPNLAEHYRDAVANNGSAPFGNLAVRLPLRRPELVGTLITGETAGSLGPALIRCALLFSEDATRGEVRVIRGASMTLYGITVIIVVIRVVTFYTNYLDQFSRIK